MSHPYEVIVKFGRKVIVKELFSNEKMAVRFQEEMEQRYGFAHTIQFKNRRFVK